MNWKLFFLTFISIFFAELGDKTQLATISFTSSNIKYKWIVFFASAGALVLTSFLGVFFGSLLTKYVSPKTIRIISGSLFIIIGIIILLSIKEVNAKKVNKLQCEIEKIVSEGKKCINCSKFNNYLISKKISNDKYLKIINEDSSNNKLNDVCDKSDDFLQCETERIKKKFN